MNQDDLAQLRLLVERRLAVASKDRDQGKYWYPLSVPTYGADEVLATIDLLCSYETTMATRTRIFEERFVAALGFDEGVMVNSGSSADLLIAFALTNPAVGLLRPGDEVLMPAVTWPTQVWSAMMAGLNVRFVDVDPATLNVNLDDLEERLTPRTRALSLVHLMGNPCDMDRIVAFCRRHDLILIEDCCESLGASWRGRPVGTFGVAASFSFFFSHHLMTMEGGMVACQDSELSDVLRLLRAHGWSRNVQNAGPYASAGLDARYTFVNWGFNVRPTELNAAFGMIQLERLPAFQAQRLANVERVQRLLEPYSEVLRMMQVDPRSTCSWFAIPLLVDGGAPFTRDELASHLEQSGVETRPIVAGNLLRQPALEYFPPVDRPSLPGADYVHDHGLYIGLHPFDATDKLDRLATVVGEFLSGVYRGASSQHANHESIG